MGLVCETLQGYHAENNSCDNRRSPFESVGNGLENNIDILPDALSQSWPWLLPSFFALSAFFAGFSLVCSLFFTLPHDISPDYLPIGNITVAMGELVVC